MSNYNVILINPDIPLPYNVSYPPYGCLFIAPHLKNVGYRVRVFDAQKEKISVLKDIVTNSKGLIWIGFSVIRGPAIQSSLNISKIIKKCNPDVPLVWGGSFPTLIPTQALENELVDIVVMNEGEHASVELTQALSDKQDLDGIKGIGFKRDGKIILNPPREFIKDWDNKVRLGWDFIDPTKYFNYIDGKRHLEIITSRGCPFRCAFCWNMTANLRKLRGWSADRVIEELKSLEKYGIEYITFADDYFDYYDTDRVIRIADYFKKKNIVWSLGNGLRVGNHLEKLLTLLKDSNCTYVSFGSESGSQRVLDYINKDISIEQILESARLTVRYNIGARYSWMIGFPNETKEDIFKTLKMIDEIRSMNKKTGHFIGIFSPEPGTRLFDEAVAKYLWIPPTKLSQWAKLREELNYPYIKDIWFLRCISFSSFLYFKIDSPISVLNINCIYIVPLKILIFISRLRWRYKFFKFPIEVWLALKAKKFMRRLV